MVERLIAQLAHAEVITPKPEKSAAFFKNVLGLEESGRAGQSIYFRGWGEFFHHSLQLTEGQAPAIGHTGWRRAAQDLAGRNRLSATAPHIASVRLAVSSTRFSGNQNAIVRRPI
jgi:catechol 2,3-dioxygenase-like lactoylglutathione lyase family enzyme